MPSKSNAIVSSLLLPCLAPSAMLSTAANLGSSTNAWFESSQVPFDQLDEFTNDTPDATWMTKHRDFIGISYWMLLPCERRVESDNLESGE